MISFDLGRAAVDPRDARIDECMRDRVLDLERVSGHEIEPGGGGWSTVGSPSTIQCSPTSSHPSTAGFTYGHPGLAARQPHKMIQGTFHHVWVCLCRDVTTTTIVRVVGEGATSVRAVSIACGAGSDCTKCRRTILRMLADLRVPADKSNEVPEHDP